MNEDNVPLEYILPKSVTTSPIKVKEFANINYAQVCYKELTTILAFMVRIKNKRFFLSNYVLSVAHCHAIGQALRKFPDFADTFLLSENNISDDMLGVLFEAMQFLRHLKSFTIKGNVFGTKSL